MDIKQLLGDKYMERFKVRHSQVLFDIPWEVLKQHKCPLCFNKLRIPIKGKMALCNGVKHRYPFLIAKDKLNKI